MPAARPISWKVLTMTLSAALAMPVMHASVVLANPPQVQESSPAANEIIHGRHAEYVIRFDRPVDHAASHLEITQSGRIVQSLPFLLDSAPDVLFASGDVARHDGWTTGHPSCRAAGRGADPGHYLLHWQARSSADATVSNGDIPFSVARGPTPSFSTALTVNDGWQAIVGNVAARQGRGDQQKPEPTS